MAAEHAEGGTGAPMALEEALYIFNAERELLVREGAMREIKRAYKAKALQLHPDKSGLNASNHLFVLLTRAYKTLRHYVVALQEGGASSDREETRRPREGGFEPRAGLPGDFHRRFQEQRVPGAHERGYGGGSTGEAAGGRGSDLRPPVPAPARPLRRFTPKRFNAAFDAATRRCRERALVAPAVDAGGLSRWHIAARSTPLHASRIDDFTIELSGNVQGTDLQLAADNAVLLGGTPVGGHAPQPPPLGGHAPQPRRLGVRTPTFYHSD